MIKKIDLSDKSLAYFCILLLCFQSHAQCMIHLIPGDQSLKIHLPWTPPHIPHHLNYARFGLVLLDRLILLFWCTQGVESQWVHCLRGASLSLVSLSFGSLSSCPVSANLSIPDLLFGIKMACLRPSHIFFSSRSRVLFWSLCRSFVWTCRMSLFLFWPATVAMLCS